MYIIFQQGGRGQQRAAMSLHGCLFARVWTWSLLPRQIFYQHKHVASTNFNNRLSWTLPSLDLSILFHRIHDFDLQTRPNAPTPPEARVLSLLGQLVVGMADRCCGRSVTSSSPNHPPIAPEISHLQSGTKRAKFPLGFQHANNYHAPRAVLVG